MSWTDSTQAIIEAYGYRADGPPDPAEVLPVLLARAGDSCEAEATRLSRSVGLYSVIAGGLAPLGVLADRHGLHGVEPAPARTLLAACSTFQSMIQVVQIRMQVARISPQSDQVLDTLHGRRRDGEEFPDLDGLRPPFEPTEWSDIAARGLLPHPDSLTGIPERLQLIGLVLRNHQVLPRDIAILHDGGLLCTIPAGMRFECPVIADGVYEYRWTVDGGQLRGLGLTRLERAGFRIDRERGSTLLCIDSTRAHALHGVIGRANGLCPTLRWPTRR